MTKFKKTQTSDALLDAASKDAKITLTEISEEELKSVSGGVSLSFAKINMKYTPVDK